MQQGYLSGLMWPQEQQNWPMSHFRMIRPRADCPPHELINQPQEGPFTEVAERGERKGEEGGGGDDPMLDEGLRLEEST